MFHKRGQKALYEVLTKGTVKSSSDKTIEPLHSQQKNIWQRNETETDFVKSRRFEWPLKAKLSQFFKGKLDFSLPYTIVSAVVLFVVLLMIVCFKLGQIWSKG
jgi:hypothetical protein